MAVFLGVKGILGLQRSEKQLRNDVAHKAKLIVTLSTLCIVFVTQPQVNSSLF